MGTEADSPSTCWRSGSRDKSRLRHVLATVFLCISTTQTARATEPFAQAGTYGATFAGLPRGVRNIGMGATGAADVSGFSAGYFNPASLAWTETVIGLGSYEEWGLGNLSLSDFHIISPFPFHADSTGMWRLGGSLGYARLSMDPQVVRTIFLPEGTGETYDADDWLLSGSGAASWRKGWASVGAGGTAKFIRQGFAGGGVSTWSFDLGIIAAFPIGLGGGLVRPRAGCSILNLDTGAEYDGRESSVANEKRAAIGFDMLSQPVYLWGRPVPAMAVTIDYDWIDKETSSVDFGAGAELSLVGLLHGRYGTMGDAYSTYGFGLGWDYGSWLFRLDYASDSLVWDRDTFGALVGVRW